MFVEWQLSFQEGKNDPGIFKAIFTAGGPGSGKSTVAQKLGVFAMGGRPINSDTAFENALKKAGLSLKLDTIDPETIDSMRVRAKKVSNKQLDLAINGRLGLVIDSTARNMDRISAQKDMLEKIGYETAMVFVDTSLETALERNAARPRSVPVKVVKKSHGDIHKNKMKLKKLFGKNYWEIPNNGDLRDLEKNTTKMFSRVSSWMGKIPNNKQVKAWFSQFESLVELEEANMKKQILKKNKAAVDQFGQVISSLSKVHYDPDKPEESLNKAFGAIRKGRWSPAQWDKIHHMVDTLDGFGFKFKSLKGMYMGRKNDKSRFYEDDIEERVDRRAPAKRDVQRMTDKMKDHEKKMTSRIRSKPAKAAQELKIAIATFKKYLPKATNLTKPIIQGQIDKYSNILTMLATTESVGEETIIQMFEETNTGSIPQGPESIGVSPDSKFAGNPVFDCDDETFSQCIKGKKKYGRWSTYLGKDNPFFGKMQSWMKQSYKNKNFIMRNAKSGAMVYARNPMGEGIDESRMADLSKNKALKVYMDDPIYKAILQATSPNDLKKAMKVARSIRGNTAFNNFQKAVKDLLPEEMQEALEEGSRQDWFGLKKLLGKDSFKFGQDVVKSINKMKKSRFKNIPNPGSHIKSVTVKDVDFADAMNPFDYFGQIQFEVEFTGATSMPQKMNFAIAREVDANNDKVVVYSMLSRESRGTYRMSVKDKPAMVISSLIQRYYENVILPKVSKDMEGFAKHYSNSPPRQGLPGAGRR